MEKRSSNQSVIVSEWTMNFIKCLDAVRSAHQLTSQTAKQYFSRGNKFNQSDYDECFGDMEKTFREMERMISDEITANIGYELDDQIMESGDPISRL